MDEAEVRQRARRFVAGVDASNIRNDLTPYLTAANASLRREALGAGESGYTLTRSSGKHVITVNESEPEERQRFTVCHELAHILLELASLHGEQPSWAYAKRDRNEVMCDVFASELLMPYQQWLAAVPNEDPSASVIEYMADAFRTSYPAAASRYASLSPLPCAYVTMEAGLVRYPVLSTALRNIGARIQIKTPIPPGSVAYRLRGEGRSCTERDEVPRDVWFDTLDSSDDLSEICRHYASYDSTLSLLWFPLDDLPAVEVNRFGARVEEDELLKELTGELSWPGRRRRR